MADWVEVCPLDDVPPGTIRSVQAGRARIALVNVDGDLYALHDQCSHQNLPLSDGELNGTDLTCIYHGAKFDVCSGRAKGLPAIRPVKTYPVEVRDGVVFVDPGGS